MTLRTSQVLIAAVFVIVPIVAAKWLWTSYTTYFGEGWLPFVVYMGILGAIAVAFDRRDARRRREAEEELDSLRTLQAEIDQHRERPERHSELIGRSLFPRRRAFRDGQQPRRE